jgi:hypothetical protein
VHEGLEGQGQSGAGDRAAEEEAGRLIFEFLPDVKNRDKFPVFYFGVSGIPLQRPARMGVVSEFQKYPDMSVVHMRNFGI